MTRRPRVVFVGNFGLWRKGTMGCRSLPMAGELRAAGADARLVVPPWDDPAASGQAELVHGVPVQNVAVPAGGPAVARHAAIALRLLRATLAQRPDVVVCVKPKAYAGLLALLLRRLPLRVVVDTDDWEGRGGWIELAPTPRLLKDLVARHERAVLGAADQITVASRALETLVASVGRPTGRITYLPNATWPGAAGWARGNRLRGRRALGLADQARLVLLYSRLFEFDAGRVAAAIGRLLRRAPEARLLVVGAALHGQDAGFGTELRRAGVLDRCRFLGWAKRGELPDLLAAADVALVPMDDTLVNRCRCSVKLLDLMLAGRTIVADRVGQAAEYLEDGASGRLVSPRDGAAMAEAALELLREPGLAGRLGRLAEEAARGRFTWTAQRGALTSAILDAGEPRSYASRP
ncbi:MAG TPA: glycosyltransferase [Chloroflexota bacterium]|jgi:glycosyltransferase involved in cell wall biosynthesis|nr:glycosyltransferase [Chloroflexota bacterium]